VLDKSVDASGNSVHLANMIFRVKNLAFRSGHIDKVEVVPYTTLRDIPKVEVVSIEKRALNWREDQTIAVRALFTFSGGILGGHGQPKESKAFDLEVKLFDNFGRQLGRYQDGFLARMIVKGKFTSP
jgi:hypothetical protein